MSRGAGISVLKDAVYLKKVKACTGMYIPHERFTLLA